MPNFPLPPAAIPADLPGEVRLQIVSSCAEPPVRGGWLHEVKHDGHRLVAIAAGERLKLVSRPRCGGSRSGTASSEML
jgi:hypothetical protein